MDSLGCSPSWKPNYLVDLWEQAPHGTLWGSWIEIGALVKQFCSSISLGRMADFDEPESDLLLHLFDEINESESSEFKSLFSWARTLFFRAPCWRLLSPLTQMGSLQWARQSMFLLRPLCILSNRITSPCSTWMALDSLNGKTSATPLNAILTSNLRCYHIYFCR